MHQEIELPRAVLCGFFVRWERRVSSRVRVAARRQWQLRSGVACGRCAWWDWCRAACGKEEETILDKNSAKNMFNLWEASSTQGAREMEKTIEKELRGKQHTGLRCWRCGAKSRGRCAWRGCCRGRHGCYRRARKRKGRGRRWRRH